MMFTMPVYDMMLLPGVTFYFKKDIFQQLGNQDAKAGDDVLFLMQRTDKDRKDLTPEDFYPVGVSGKLDSVDNEGNIRIRTVARVDLSDLEMAEDGILANASIRPDTEDITPEEEKAIFDRVKNVLLNYISQFQWGVLARNYVLHWKNLEETLCAVSGYIHIPWEDKYRIIETDSRKERCELIEKAIREAIEVNRVGVHKGRGLEWLAHHLGCTLANVIAIGDSENDLTMLQMAGLGVAMANSEPCIREAADVITGSNTENGVAQAIYRHILGDER